jgi:hypothetical protein
MDDSFDGMDSALVAAQLVCPLSGDADFSTFEVFPRRRQTFTLRSETQKPKRVIYGSVPSTSISDMQTLHAELADISEDSVHRSRNLKRELEDFSDVMNSTLSDAEVWLRKVHGPAKWRSPSWAILSGTSMVCTRADTQAPSLISAEWLDWLSRKDLGLIGQGILLITGWLLQTAMAAMGFLVSTRCTISERMLTILDLALHHASSPTKFANTSLTEGLLEPARRSYDGKSEY